VSRPALVAGDLELAARPCMNPASILWQAWREPGRPGVQQTRKTREVERPIVILNRDKV
jgi:hypothetical protein